MSDRQGAVIVASVTNTDLVGSVIYGEAFDKDDGAWLSEQLQGLRARWLERIQIAEVHGVMLPHGGDVATEQLPTT